MSCTQHYCIRNCVKRTPQNRKGYLLFNKPACWLVKHILCIHQCVSCCVRSHVAPTDSNQNKIAPLSLEEFLWMEWGLDFSEGLPTLQDWPGVFRNQDQSPGDVLKAILDILRGFPGIHHVEQENHQKKFWLLLATLLLNHFTEWLRSANVLIS